jgi:hypothetical protein
MEIDDHVAEQIKLLRLTILDAGLDQPNGSLFSIFLELLLLTRRTAAPGDLRAIHAELQRQGIAPRGLLAPHSGTRFALAFPAPPPALYPPHSGEPRHATPRYARLEPFMNISVVLVAIISAACLVSACGFVPPAPPKPSDAHRIAINRTDLRLYGADPAR